jgi:hypothetical protein
MIKNSETKGRNKEVKKQIKYKKTENHAFNITERKRKRDDIYQTNNQKKKASFKNLHQKLKFVAMFQYQHHF